LTRETNNQPPEGGKEDEMSNLCHQKQHINQIKFETLNLFTHSGERQKQIDAVFSILRTASDEGVTDREIQAILAIRGINLDASTVSARRNDIFEHYHHRVEVAQKRPCRITGKTKNAWRLALPPSILNLKKLLETL